MSSLARRALRTTAAAAGIAALGTGLAGNAVAAPAAGPEAPTPGPTAAPQGLTSALPLAGLPSTPAVPGLTNLPILFVFEAPTINTAGPSTPSTPGTPATNIDVIANLQRVVGSDTTNQQGSTVDTDDAGRTSSTPAQDGALSALDTAGLFGGLAPGSDVNTDRNTGLD